MIPKVVSRSLISLGNRKHWEQRVLSKLFTAKYYHNKTHWKRNCK